MTALLATACSSGDTYCAVIDTRCDGSVARNCSTNSGPNDVTGGTYHHAEYSSETCAANTFCRVDAVLHVALCSVTPDPDPACTKEKQQHCDGNTAVQCFGEHPIERRDCSVTCIEKTSSDSTSSRAGKTEAFCALAKMQDPRCPPDAPGRTTICDGTTRRVCEWGYLSEDPDYACAVGSTCVDFAAVSGETCIIQFSDSQSDSRTACVLSAQPDPLCIPDAFSICDGSTSVRCACGYRISQETCQSCQSSKNGAITNAGCH